MHGYALLGEVAASLGRRPGVATIYASLEKLEDTGWITQDRDEVVDGRLRRYFTITSSGLDTLATEARELAHRAERAERKLETIRATAEFA